MNPILLVKKSDGALYPASLNADDYVQSLKTGQAIEIKPTKQAARSLRHHRLYWGGLIALAMQYWEPSGGLVADCERKTIERFLEWGGDSTGIIGSLFHAFLAALVEKRKSMIEMPPATKESLHEWIKQEAGYFDYEQTPTGIRKVTKSINFNSMPQEKFTKFYQDAFSVVWKFILSQTFENEEQAQNAIDQLVSMG